VTGPQTENTGTEPATSVMAADAVRNAAREGAPDRYLAALLAPKRARDDLITLAAFCAEIEKIALQVSEPHLGEIRIQWWRDALGDGTGLQKTGHPIADAFATTIRGQTLPGAMLNDYLDAHVHALYADPPTDDAQLMLELDLREGILFALAAHILGRPGLDPSAGIVRDAAQAYGLARLGLNLPMALARGRVPLPPAWIEASGSADEPQWRNVMRQLDATARRHLKHISAAYGAEMAAVKAALLPIALVEPYLRALTRSGHDPARDLASIAPLTRTWRLAKTHMRGRF
jgi:15-cis-phytoene synthase